eukprot:TRINITY_DN81493_c0_g1_i1.p1 TRINITY_DN81493_c0_g1~~TRINITY_DN81493_c0_g1_i1.p1  ORF type:complete len:267 (-),score=15.18 TRINITY_DN81493_c0_g1_i1:111-911(-)
MTDRYSFSLTTFSPSGKLVQIEHALSAVNQGVTSIGVKARNGIVIATEKKAPSPLQDVSATEKVVPICKTMGLVYSGMGPDARVLVSKARKSAEKYRCVYRETPPTLVLVKEIANVMQEFTQSGGVRPFGVSLLVCGHDSTHGLGLYQVDPSGTFFPWNATAIGKNHINARTFLERRYNEALELEDAVHIAILTLKESYEGQMTAGSIEIGVVTEQGTQTQDEMMDVETEGGQPAYPSDQSMDQPEPKISFRKLSEAEVADYLELA